MPTLNVWMPCYDDLEQLRAALDSLEPYLETMDVHAYVVDGRYATFEGATDLTPGAEEVATGEGSDAADLEDGYPSVTYTHPPDLPLGDPDVADHLRSPQHEQAKWVNYELLPDDEWVLEMDTDERVEHIALDLLTNLDPEKKYTPQVLTPEGEQLWPAIRLYQPQYWTFWIDDVMFWRQFYPRNTPIEDLFEAHTATAHRNTNYGGETEAIQLRNYGTDRPEEYQERRADQLETMGTPWAARAIRDGERPSLVDLTEYAEAGEEAMQR